MKSDAFFHSFRLCWKKIPPDGGIYKFFWGQLRLAIHALELVDYFIYDAILDCRFGVHPVISFKIFSDAFNGLAGIFGQDLRAHFLGAEDLLGVYLHIGANCLDMTA